MDGLLVQHGGNGAQIAQSIHVLQRHACQGRRFAHNGDKTRRQQRMAAKVQEKIGIERDRLRRQHFLRRAEQDRFAWRARILLGIGGGNGGEHGALEAVAVDLARRQARQGVERLVAGGHHIGRQAGAKLAAQCLGIGLEAALGHQKGHELVHAIVVAQHYGGLGNSVLPGQFSFDFTKLDTKAANLDLIVDAAAKGDVAVVVDGHGIAGAIEHGVDARRAKRICDEFFSCQRCAVEIALRDTRPADQQLALDAGVDNVQAFVHDIAGVIGNWPADGDGIVGADFGHGCHNGRFGWTVGIENTAMRPAPALAERLRAGLPPKDHDAQALDIAGEQRQQCGHGIEHRHAGLFHHFGQLVGFAHDFRRGDEQGGTHQIGDPDFLHRQVESHRRALEHHVPRVDFINFVGGAQVMANVGIADDNAFGHAGRAGCVDQIGRVLAGCPQGARIDCCYVAGIGQHLRCQHRARKGGTLGGESRRCQQCLGVAII